MNSPEPRMPDGGGDGGLSMRVAMILAAAGAAAAMLLAGCAGAYVAVDGGAHSQGHVRVGTNGSR
jgi:hypothetical protein